MNTNSFITAEGILLDGNSITQKEAPIHLCRKGKTLHAVIRKSASINALLSLIRVIRAFEDLIHVTYNQNNKQVEIGPAPSDIICLAIGRFALLKAEASRQKLSQSHLYSSGDAIRHDQSLPDVFRQLIASHSPSDLTSNALLKLHNHDLSGTSFYFSKQTSIFCLGKIPDHYFWPEKILLSNDSVDKENFGQNAEAIMIVLETALACRTPILQKGLMKSENSEVSEFFPFARLAIPMASIAEQPFNYRVLTMAIRQSDNAVMV